MDGIKSTDSIGNIIEAVLFSAGEPINFKDILDMAEDLDFAKPDFKNIVLQFAETYNAKNSGLEVVVAGEYVQLVARAEHIEHIRKVLKSNARQIRSLSKSAFEILAVVAYNQPVTKNYIEQQRGVDCAYMIGSLMEKGYMEEKGRLDLPGKPYVYGTTAKFLSLFGLSDISELPQIENFKSEIGGIGFLAESEG
ncbi:MAG: SMC-Scp complex subunit ScpB [Oscillospiraceae bacterium]|nr:SMC-Scp complex subunit ScpB [Oscillospiraceae bacterium]